MASLLHTIKSIFTMLLVMVVRVRRPLLTIASPKNLQVTPPFDDCLPHEMFYPVHPEALFMYANNSKPSLGVMRDTYNELCKFIKSQPSIGVDNFEEYVHLKTDAHNALDKAFTFSANTTAFALEVIRNHNSLKHVEPVDHLECHSANWLSYYWL